MVTAITRRQTIIEFMVGSLILLQQTQLTPALLVLYLYTILQQRKIIFLISAAIWFNKSLHTFFFYTQNCSAPFQTGAHLFLQVLQHFVIYVFIKISLWCFPAELYFIVYHATQMCNTVALFKIFCSLF